MFELPGRNIYHLLRRNRGAESFQHVAEFITGERPDVADDRVLATVLFTDIVDLDQAGGGDGLIRDWHAFA